MKNAGSITSRDIVVSGMGGELIEKIVSSSHYAQKSGVRARCSAYVFLPPELEKMA